jgi:hypothetical protein
VRSERLRASLQTAVRAVPYSWRRVEERVARVRASLVATLALAGAAFVAPAAPTTQASASAAATAPVCSAPALTIAKGFIQAAAGNLGFPVIITNHGSTACSLDGFPSVTAHTEARSPHPVTFVHFSRSQIYVTAKARLVLVPPRGTASFGVSSSDAYDQQYGEGPRCLMNSITVHLPRVAPLARDTLSLRKDGDGFGGDVNFCFAGFEFGLTPIVKGSHPPDH